MALKCQLLLNHGDGSLLFARIVEAVVDLRAVSTKYLDQILNARVENTSDFNYCPSSTPPLKTEALSPAPTPADSSSSSSSFSSSSSSATSSSTSDLGGLRRSDEVGEDVDMSPPQSSLENTERSPIDGKDMKAEVPLSGPVLLKAGKEHSPIPSPPPESHQGKKSVRSKPEKTRQLVKHLPDPPPLILPGLEDKLLARRGRGRCVETTPPLLPSGPPPLLLPCQSFAHYKYRRQNCTAKTSFFGQSAGFLQELDRRSASSLGSHSEAMHFWKGDMNASVHTHRPTPGSLGMHGAHVAHMGSHSPARRVEVKEEVTEADVPCVRC